MSNRIHGRRQMAYSFQFKKNISSIILIPHYRNHTIQLSTFGKYQKIGQIIENRVFLNHKIQIT